MYYKRLYELREEHNLTQKEVASEININQRNYSYYEKGQRTLPPHVLCALADFYGVSTDYILGRTDVKKPYPKE